MKILYPIFSLILLSIKVNKIKCIDYKLNYPNNSIELYNNITSAKLYINYYGKVTDESCLKLTTALNALDLTAKELKMSFNEEKLKPIELHIQSYGGSLMPAFYVCDVIKNLDTPVHTYIDGYAASAATLISVCGNKRFITKFSKILIHQLSTAHRGTSADFEDYIKNINLFMDNIRTIYLENSKLKLYKLNSLLSKNIWLNSTLAFKYGLVDKIL